MSVSAWRGAGANAWVSAWLPGKRGRARRAAQGDLHQYLRMHCR